MGSSLSCYFFGIGCPQNVEVKDLQWTAADQARQEQARRDTEKWRIENEKIQQAKDRQLAEQEQARQRENERLAAYREREQAETKRQEEIAKKRRDNEKSQIAQTTKDKVTLVSELRSIVDSKRRTIRENQGEEQTLRTGVGMDASEQYATINFRLDRLKQVVDEGKKYGIPCSYAAQVLDTEVSKNEERNHLIGFAVTDAQSDASYAESIAQIEKAEQQCSVEFSQKKQDVDAEQAERARAEQAERDEQGRAERARAEQAERDARVQAAEAAGMQQAEEYTRFADKIRNSRNVTREIQQYAGALTPEEEADRSRLATELNDALLQHKIRGSDGQEYYLCADDNRMIQQTLDGLSDNSSSVVRNAAETFEVWRNAALANPGRVCDDPFPEVLDGPFADEYRQAQTNEEREEVYGKHYVAGLANVGAQNADVFRSVLGPPSSSSILPSMPSFAMRDRKPAPGSKGQLDAEMDGGRRRYANRRRRCATRRYATRRRASRPAAKGKRRKYTTGRRRR